jgi:RNA polymerase sigma-70 factor, ECF subfamily
MADDPGFDDLMARLKAGDEAAAAEVFNRFAHRLIGLARSRLDPLVRRKADPEDVLQSVFRSFFLRQAAGQLDLSGWDSLWGLLTVLTVRKCGRRVEHFRAARRDVRRETAPAAQDDSAPTWEGVASDPTPEEAAALAETVEQLLRGLDDRDQQIVVLCLQGYSSPEIGDQVSCTERTVQRVLTRVRKRLERVRGDEAGGKG